MSTTNSQLRATGASTGPSLGISLDSLPGGFVPLGSSFGEV